MDFAISLCRFGERNEIAVLDDENWIFVLFIVKLPWICGNNYLITCKGVNEDNS